MSRGNRKPTRGRRTAPRYSVVPLTLTLACTVSGIDAVSLDEAIEQEILPPGAAGAPPCLNLAPAGGSGLEALCIAAGSTGGIADSVGGNAATPTSLPSRVARRILRDRCRRDQENCQDYRLSGLGTLWRHREPILLAAAANAGTGDAGAAPLELSEAYGAYSFYLTGEFEALDRDTTAFEDGYDSNIGRLNAGVDRQWADNTVFGVAIHLARHDGDYDNGGGFTNDAIGVVLYGSVTPTPEWFVQLSGGVAKRWYDRDRVAMFLASGAVIGSDSPKADFDVIEYSAEIQAGRDYRSRGLTFGPRFGINWIYADYDAYSENGNGGLALSFQDDDRTSVQSSVGLTGTAAVSTDFGVVVPQMGIAWKHEFADDQRDVQFSFVDDTGSNQFSYQTDEPDRDFFELSAGLTFVLPNDTQVFVNYRSLIGHSHFTSHAGSLGIRIGF